MLLFGVDVNERFKMNTVQKCQFLLKGSRLSGFTDYLKQKYYQQTLGNQKTEEVPRFYTRKEIKDLVVIFVHRSSNHALIQDYTAIGISNDDPEIVKGRAGLPKRRLHNPDLLQSSKSGFEALIARTHQGIKIK
jgi:hypothetical protein